MRHRIVPLLAAASAVAAVLAMPSRAAAGNYEGQVVQVQESVQLANGGERQQITVRTRDGEELRFHLGAPGSCPDCVAVGDQGQVRTTSRAQADGSLQVRRLAVGRTDQEHTFCNRSGELVPVQSRAASGGGSGQGAGNMDRTRDRDRIHVPGTGTGMGSGSAGSGQRAGGRRNGGG